jgi:hypothetical protein
VSGRFSPLGQRFELGQYVKRLHPHVTGNSSIQVSYVGSITKYYSSSDIQHPSSKPLRQLLLGGIPSPASSHKPCSREAPFSFSFMMPQMKVQFMHKPIRSFNQEKRWEKKKTTASPRLQKHHPRTRKDGKECESAQCVLSAESWTKVNTRGFTLLGCAACSTC